jgi:hypothetical protein
MTIIESLNDVAPEWLGEILGVDIVDLSMMKNDAFNSSVAHLALTYSKPVSLPYRILLKLNQDHDGLHVRGVARAIEKIECGDLLRGLGAWSRKARQQRNQEQRKAAHE